MEAGEKLLQKNDAGRAILQFQNAVKVTPRKPEAYFQLALAYLAARDIPRAVAALRKTLELNPKHEGAQLRLAQLMTGADDAKTLQDAQQRLQSLLQGAPENADTLHALALTELKLGEAGDATQHLERAMEAAPQELLIAVTLAQAKSQQGDFKGAEEILKKACANSPKSADAVVFLGRFYAAQNKLDEAGQQFQRALAMEPNHAPALLNLAMLQNRTGRKQEAEKSFQRLSGLPEKMVKPVYGLFLFQEGRREEAIREFERLAKQDPDDRVARTRLVVAYQAANRLDDARAVLNAALKKNQKDQDALLQRGELFLDAGQYGPAEADLNKVLHLTADSAEAHYAAARLHQARGATMMQRKELSEALRLKPSLLPARLEMARVLTEGSAAKAALDLLDAAPDNQKNLVGLIQQRNWALLSTGQLAEARKGVDAGLTGARTTDLLLQDGILKISGKRYAEARLPLREALKNSPEDVRILRVLVGSYTAQNQMPAAVEEIRAYAAQHPKSGGIQYFWANLLLQTGDRVHAKQVLIAAKAANADPTQIDMSLAQIDLTQANWNDARQELTAILARNGDNAVARKWMGMLEVSAGNQAAAVVSFRKVLESDPNNAVALSNLAYLLVENGNQTEEPLKYAQKAKELEPDNPEFDDTLGWVLYHRGVYSVAVKHLERAASKQAAALHLYHLAMAYYKAGQETRGRTTLQAAMRMNPNLPETKIAQQMFDTPGKRSGAQ